MDLEMDFISHLDSDQVKKRMRSLVGLMVAQEPLIIPECVIFHQAAISLGSLTNN